MLPPPSATARQPKRAPTSNMSMGQTRHRKYSTLTNHAGAFQDRMS